MREFLTRALAALLALAALAGVVYLGILSGKHAKFVVWFGIASAIAAPLGLSLLAYAVFRGDREVIEGLSKVPEIARLISEAKTQEERIRLLEGQRDRLAETVRLESRRQAVMQRREDLEKDGVRLLRELETLDEEARALDLQIGESAAREMVLRLHERVKAREAGDVVLRIGPVNSGEGRKFNVWLRLHWFAPAVIK